MLTRFSWVAVLAPLALLVACGDDGGNDDGPPDVDLGHDDTTPTIEPLFASEVLPGCTYASPILVQSQGQELVLSVGQKGRILAVDPISGDTVFTYDLPVDPEDDFLDVLPTPAAFDGGTKLMLGYMENVGEWTRQSAEAVVFDLETRELSADFPPLEFAATIPTAAGTGDVVFDATFQLLRSEIRIVEVEDRDLGLAYVSFGNGPSEQPFHGWVFEIDLDAWRDGGDPFSASLVTTRENECGPDRNRDPMLCGGGVWNAAGPYFHDLPDGSLEILVPTGNGRVDLAREAYAHSVMRTGRGLVFDDGCDPALCADFDELDPDPACLETCSDVFIARETADSPLARPADGRCEGLSFQECYGALDADLGANSPVVVQPAGGPEVVVQGGKDGAIYLVDREHLGRLYQRIQLLEQCGAEDDVCRAYWIGMLVTQPAVATIDGDPIVIFPSVMADRTHPSGVTALRIHMVDGEPRMEIFWQVPEFDTELATEVFRHHPGRPIIVDWNGEPYVLVVETRRSSPGDIATPPGLLWGIRVRDGQVAFTQEIANAGQRFAIPLLVDDRVYISTCSPVALEDGQLQGFRLRDR